MAYQIIPGPIPGQEHAEYHSALLEREARNKVVIDSLGIAYFDIAEVR